MRSTSFKVMKGVLVLVMLIPAVALANEHLGYSYATVTPTTVAPGDTITVEFEYTVYIDTSSTLPPYSLWEIRLDAGFSRVDENQILIPPLIEGHPYRNTPGEHTFYVNVDVTIPETTEDGQHTLEIYSCPWSYQSAHYGMWYTQPDTGLPITITVGQLDSDGDGLSDDDELNIYGTDPEDPDTDDDGLWDGTEVEMAAGSGCPDPLNPDSDGDTLLDGAEVALGTNPCVADSDGDGIPDNIDPYPLNPEGTEGYIEEELRSEADFILTIDLNLFTGPNNNANKGRRGSLSNRANAAANQVANANYQEAVDILFSLLDRVDGVEPPKDWMLDSSPERVALEIDLMVMIELLGYYL